MDFNPSQDFRVEIDHQCVKWNTHINNLLRLLIRGLTSIIPEKVNPLNLSPVPKSKFGMFQVSGLIISKHSLIYVIDINNLLSYAHKTIQHD